MTRYYFIRHGESAANARGVVAGWSDIPLTQKGLEQAHAVAESIRHDALTFDLIISSPLSRALDTASIVAQANDYPIEDILVIDELKEKSSGRLELRSRDEVYGKTEAQMVGYGGEDAEMFLARVRVAFEHIQEVVGDNQTVLIVAHAGIYKAAAVLAQGVDDPSALYKMSVPKNADLLELPFGVYVGY
jgi:broad specificity phosphatase PhoE